jgi:hypothetical protein
MIGARGERADRGAFLQADGKPGTRDGANDLIAERALRTGFR